MRDEELVATSSRHVAEVRGINRELIEKALRMRCLAYLAHVKTGLLTDTIYEMKRSKVALKNELAAREGAETELRKHRVELEALVDARTTDLRESNRNLQREILEKARLEAQLVQAQKMEAIGTLAGGIAHEFNNLLTVVLGGVETALRELPESSDQAGYLRDAQEAAERAVEMAAQMLSLSRIEEPEMEPIDPNEMVKRVASLLRSSISTAIEIELSLEEGVPKIEASWSRLSQALLNLGINARDAMPGGGRMVFETRAGGIDEEYVRLHASARAGRFVRIAVSDSGVGIPEKALPRIFDPFYTTKERDKGTGLGLAMVYGSMQAHNGWINVYSEEGLGTTFALYFSALNDEARAAPPEEALPRGTETVLVVDDSDAVLLHARSVLEGCGYRIVTARDGLEGLDRLAEQQDDIAIVVTDLVMPRCGGRELLAALRDRGSSVPVVLISGYLNYGWNQSERIREQGFTAFVAKPLEAKTLATTVRRVLDAGSKL